MMVKVNPGNPELDKMSEEELAEYLYERRDDDSLWERKAYKLKPGKRGASLVFQMRVPAKDLDEIARAGLAHGGNLSEFVRSAALEKARRLSGEEGVSTADLLTKKLAEVQELVQRLQEEAGIAPRSPARKRTRPRATL